MTLLALLIFLFYIIQVIIIVYVVCIIIKNFKKSKEINNDESFIYDKNLPESQKYNGYFYDEYKIRRIKTYNDT